MIGPEEPTMQTPFDSDPNRLLSESEPDAIAKLEARIAVVEAELSVRWKDRGDQLIEAYAHIEALTERLEEAQRDTAILNGLQEKIESQLATCTPEHQWVLTRLLGYIASSRQAVPVTTPGSEAAD